jgi:CRISPR-associated protein Cmr4
MYKKGYGIIETQAPLHVGASAGEEAGNLNLIFRDQFTQTGIIPGSSIRGRFRADMRFKRLQWLEKTIKEAGITIPAHLNLESTNPEGQSKPVKKLQWLEKKARELSIITHPAKNETQRLCTESA